VPSAEPSVFTNPFLWPFLAAVSATEATAGYIGGLAHQFIAQDSGRARGAEPSWATANSVALELQTMRLRDFATEPHGAPTLVCAPFALHGATVADFAPGHSLVEALHLEGLSRVYVTDWRSATPDMRFLSIDNYLAELNVAVEAIGPPVDLIGLCQGGWMALVYAARFPGKVRRLVLAGAPVDVRAGSSQLSRLAASMSLAAFQEMVRCGDGLLMGHRVQGFSESIGAGENASRVLQLPKRTAPSSSRRCWGRPPALASSFPIASLPAHRYVPR
jgi:pimeloyl-ACP methyl ester carboxylesterase